MKSSEFKPATSVSAEAFKNLFIGGGKKEKIKVLNNISYD